MPPKQHNKPGGKPHHHHHHHHHHNKKNNNNAAAAAVVLPPAERQRRHTLAHQLTMLVPPHAHSAIEAYLTTVIDARAAKGEVSYAHLHPSDVAQQVVNFVQRQQQQQQPQQQQRRGAAAAAAAAAPHQHQHQHHQNQNQMYHEAVSPTTTMVPAAAYPQHQNQYQYQHHYHHHHHQHQQQQHRNFAQQQQQQQQQNDWYAHYQNQINPNHAATMMMGQQQQQQNALVYAAPSSSTALRRDRGGGDEDASATMQRRQQLLVGVSTALEREYTRVEPQATDLRPLAVLIQAKEHILRKASTDPRFASRPIEGLSWLFRQLKGMRQDLKVQAIEDAFAVSVYELHANIALQLGDLSEYVQCQAALKHFYEDLGVCSTSFAVEEFTAYRLLYLALGGQNELLSAEIQAMSVRNEKSQSMAAMVLQLQREKDSKFMYLIEQYQRNKNNGSSSPSAVMLGLEEIVLSEELNKKIVALAKEGTLANPTILHDLKRLDHSADVSLDQNEVREILNNNEIIQNRSFAATSCMMRRPAIVLLLKAIGFLERGDAVNFLKEMLEIPKRFHHLPALLLMLKIFLQRIRVRWLATLCRALKGTTELPVTVLATALGFLSGADEVIHRALGPASKCLHPHHHHHDDDDDDDDKKNDEKAREGGAEKQKHHHNKHHQHQHHNKHHHHENKTKQIQHPAQYEWYELFKAIKFPGNSVPPIPEDALLLAAEAAEGRSGGEKKDKNNKLSSSQQNAPNIDFGALNAAVTEYMNYLREGTMAHRRAA